MTAAHSKQELEIGSPQEAAARYFMGLRGYAEIQPAECRKTGRHTWIFSYELPEGDLDLQVRWLHERGEWRTAVVDFALVD